MSGYAVPDDVGWSEGSHSLAEPQVVAARLPDGPPYALSGTASLIWVAAVEGGDADTVVRRVAERTDLPLAVVDSDVRSLLDELVGLGLLVGPGRTRAQSSSPSR